MKQLYFISSIFALALLSNAAYASTDSAIVTTNDFGNGTLAPNTIGFEFKVLSAFAVDSLGVYDSGQNGLSESHQAGLWNAGGSLIASVTIPSGVSALLLGLYRYAAIQPVNLVAGDTYYVGAYAPDEGDTSYCCAYPVYTDPRLSLVDFTIGNAAAFKVPDFIVPQNNYANFTLTNPVPEPTSWATMLLGFGLVGAWSRRGRQAVRGAA